MIAVFWVLAAGLAAAGAGILIWPLVRGVPPPRLDREDAALAAHRARLTEIEAGDGDSAEDRATRREARDDVARAVLRDLNTGIVHGEDQPGPAGPRARRGAALALGITFPLLAVGLYALLGEPRGLDPQTGPSAVSAAEATGLAVRELLAEAEALARASGNRLEGEPARLVERALVLAPDHRKALWFAAIAALHEDRPEDARDRLVRLRGLGTLDEEESELFDQLMAEATAHLPEP